MHTWVTMKENEVVEESEKVLKGNRFVILSADGENIHKRQM
jgi:hypothetical protein